jgi:RimJ/RimL family protein N-acetyltransferase
VLIRPIRSDDETRLVELYDHLSRHTAYQRFFSVMRRLPPVWAHYLANVDYQRRLALVVEHSGTGTRELVGVARYEATDDPGVAEVAFVLQDGWQNRGLGTALLHDLLAAAEASGIRRFRAYVLADNYRMVDLLTRFTDIETRKTDGGVTTLLFTRRRPPGSPARSS